jgi:UDP-N-acetylglucosamine--N-acetylmuramyl-(pentapeptide) pyrophosphoryl-undecaprenol N-acetylglucosamine transferase
MGGFASVPLLLACRLRKIPYCIAEQNAVPGRANRLLARGASAVFLNVREALDGFSARVRERCHITGNPVRPGFGAVSQTEARAKMGLSARGFVLGVTGGSQGARAINIAIATIARKHRSIPVLWSSGRGGYQDVKASCEGLDNVLVHPFVEDMAAFLSASDLVVSRAGATSLSELAACKTPSLLVPYPWAADDHQTKNARACEVSGAAIVVSEGEDFTERLETAILDLLGDAQRLQAMRKAAGRLHDLTTLSRMADLVEQQVRPVPLTEDR